MVINDGIGIEWVDGFRFVPTGGSVVLGRVSTAGADRRVITQSIGSEPHLGIDGSRGLSRLGVRLRPTEQGVVVEALSMNHTVKVKGRRPSREFVLEAGSRPETVTCQTFTVSFPRTMSSDVEVEQSSINRSNPVSAGSLQRGSTTGPAPSERLTFGPRSRVTLAVLCDLSLTDDLELGKVVARLRPLDPSLGGKGSQAAIKTVRRRLDSEMKRVADYLGESEPATNKVPWLARRLLLHHLVREDELHDIVSLVETRSREASS